MIPIRKVFENKEEMMKPQVKEVNGIKISFVGITQSLGDYELSEETDIKVAPEVMAVSTFRQIRQH